MPASSYGFEVGSIRCTVLTEGYFSYPAAWFFPSADPDELSRAFEGHRLPGEQVLSPYTCLLIETGSHVVLVDAGAGLHGPAGGAIVARLWTAGIRPRDIDTVIFTHAHPDHIGGAVNSSGRPVFSNARHVLAELEWDLWMTGCADLRRLRVPCGVRDSMRATARQCLHSLRFQTEPIAGESEIAPGVRAISAPGHTPGHLAVLISSEGQHLLNLGDAAVHPLHLEEPAWENGLDLAAAKAVATRRALMERAVAERMHVMAFHFPFPSVGRVTPRLEGGWRWTPGW